MTAHLHAEPYERNAIRTGYRNGYKPRHLNTRVGTLTLQVPQDRDGTFSTQLFARYLDIGDLFPSVAKEERLVD